MTSAWGSRTLRAAEPGVARSRASRAAVTARFANVTFFSEGFCAMALCPTLFVETGRAEAQVPRGLGHRPSPSGMGSGFIHPEAVSAPGRGRRGLGAGCLPFRQPRFFP